MLLPDSYEPGMPARPNLVEIYGHWFPLLKHKVTLIMPAEGNKKEIQEMPFGDVRIFTIPRHMGPILPKRVFGKLVFLRKEMKLASRIIQREDCNVVQASDSIAGGLLAICLKRKHRILFVFWYSFPLAEASLKKYRLSSSKVAYLFVAGVARFVLPLVMRHADLILTTSKWMAEDLASRGIPKKKMFPIPNGVNADLFSPTVGSKHVRQKYGLSGSRVVIYQGTLDKLRHLDILFHALALVKQQRQDVKLLMVGDGDDRANLEKLAHDLGLESEVIFTGKVPYFEVPQFIAAADIGLSPVPPLDIYKVSSPLKLFEYMGVAKPVIANEEIPEHKEILGESGGGMLVPFAPEALANAIIELLDSGVKAAEMGHRGREWVTRNRSYQILARQVEERFSELLSNYEESR